MKKHLSKILIGLMMIGVFLMPLGKTVTAQGTGGSQLDMVLSSINTTTVDVTLTFTITNTGSDSYENLLVEIYDKPWDVAQPVLPPGVTKIASDNSHPVTSNSPSQNITVSFNGVLQPGTKYFFAGWVMNNGSWWSGGWDEIAEEHGEFTTSTSSTPGSLNWSDGTGWGKTDQFGCDIEPWTWHKCITMWIYELIWTPVAYLTRVAADILDFFIFYSIKSQTYQTGFIDKSWGAVRDIANVFFILGLLYVAIKTVLDMGGGNKRLIVYIVIFALLINFSLFATKVVIDASNILTRVFYNRIDSVASNGTPLPPDSTKGKSITVGLVKQFNPHQILGKSASEDIGGFLIIMIITFLLMIYMIYMFLSVAFLFVGRIVALWLAMIFSPIAFASYAVPGRVPGFGHNEWWSMLMQNAFLAPLFVFFLYIIILFGDFLKDIAYDTTSTSWYDQMMKTVIAFAIIYIMLKKAKELAEKYSGEIGQAVRGAAATAVGVGIGSVAGVTALAGRGIVGGMASAYKAGGSRVADPDFGKFKIPFTNKEYSLGKMGQWMQKNTVTAGLRQMATFGFVKRPKAGSLQSESDRRKDEAKQRKENKDTADGGIDPASLRGKTDVRSAEFGTENKETGREKATEGTLVTGDILLEDKFIQEEKEKRKKAEADEAVAKAEAEKAPKPTEPTTEERMQKMNLSTSQNIEEAKRVRVDQGGAPAGATIITPSSGQVPQGATTIKGQPGIASSGEGARVGTGQPIIIQGPVTITGGAVVQDGGTKQTGGQKIVGGVADTVGGTESVTASKLEAKENVADKNKDKKDKKEGPSPEEKARLAKMSPEEVARERIAKMSSAEKDEELIKMAQAGKVGRDLSKTMPHAPSARTLKDRVAEGNWWSRVNYQVADKMTKGSWDFRNTKLFKMIGKQTGLNFETSFLGSQKGKGGYEKMQKDREKERTAFAKELMPSGAELSALNSLSEDMSTIENKYEEAGIRLGISNKQALKKFVDAATAGDEDYQAKKQTHDIELSRINAKRYTRRTNYSDTVARGRGFEWVLSHMGVYNPANLDAAEYLRSHSLEVQGTEMPDPQTRQLQEAIRSVMGTPQPNVAQGQAIPEQGAPVKE